MKEKKVKPPSGAFQLPALPNFSGILKKRPAPKAPGDVTQQDSPSKAKENVEGSAAEKTTGATTTATPATVDSDAESVAPANTLVVETPPTKPPPPSTGSLKRNVSPNPPVVDVSVDTATVVEPASDQTPVKPSPVKKPPRGIPMGGGGLGGALMAEMNKKLHIAPKTDQDADVTPPTTETTTETTATPVTTPAATTTTKAPAPVPPKPPKPQKQTPPQPPAKPLPPQRPPSLKRPNVPDRPKVMSRPSKDDKLDDKVDGKEEDKVDENNKVLEESQDGKNVDDSGVEEV